MRHWIRNGSDVVKLRICSSLYDSGGGIPDRATDQVMKDKVNGDIGIGFCKSGGSPDLVTAALVLRRDGKSE